MIWEILKNMLSRWLSMKRWNNYPRIEDISLLDNLGYSLHIALFLAQIEESNGEKINKEFIIKRIVFNSFKSLILSDINSWTKNYIEKNDLEIFETLWKKAVSYILSFDWPKYIKDDILETLSNKSFNKELLIINWAKKIAWLQEAQINAKIYPDIYEIPLNEINKSLKELSIKLPSLEKLLNNSKSIKYILNIRRLSHCTRWNQQNRIFSISVMAHLAFITFITYILVMIENHNSKRYPLEDMLLRALYHDIPEAITWDIITPTKKAVPWFNKLLEKVELDMMNDFLFCHISNEYREKIAPYMLDPFNWSDWKLVKCADILSALFEAKIEVNYGSENFKVIYKKIKKVSNNFNSISVDYILKQVLDSFDEKGTEDIYLENF